MHVAVASESLAETVGSFLSYLQGAMPNQSVRRVAWKAQVRALGIRGEGGEEGFLAMALNNHFRCDGPAGWHVCTRGQPLAAQSSRMREADLKRNRV